MDLHADDDGMGGRGSFYGGGECGRMAERSSLSIGIMMVTGSSSRGAQMRKSFGKFIVIDSEICHGQPTFRGSRVLVADVLDQVSAGMRWETIEEQWRGAVSQAAIAEAIALARRALAEHAPTWAAMPAHA
jgi:uncharacterized protein (DUF433 family)